MGRDRWSRRLTVEECKVISVTELKQGGHLTDISGTLNEVRLQYSRKVMAGEFEEYDYRIKLESTPCFFGGRRWWFICSKNPDGVFCGNRVGRLYLPPNARYFSCRHCYNLTYASCRQSRAFDRLIRRMAMNLKMRGQ
jgi:hypothetical protein